MQQFNNSTIQQCSKGFTLMESLVAIAVFTVGISAAIFVIQQSFTVGSRVKSKIIAAYLAQEGIEVIRNIRDRNWIAGNVYNIVDSCYGNCWIKDINDFDITSNPVNVGCVQHDYSALYSLSDATECPGGQGGLAFDGSYYVVDQNGKFKREIKTEFFPENTIPIPPEPEYLKVTSKVDCGTSCSVSLEEYLYNWK